MATSETPPTVDPAVGVYLNRVDRILPVVRAPLGQTFTGSGVVRGYVFIDGRWLKAPRADDDFADFAGLAEAALPSIPAGAADRFMLVTEGVGLSGGTDVTIDYWCSNHAGERI
jgi:hypothetical protein